MPDITMSGDIGFEELSPQLQELIMKQGGGTPTGAGFILENVITKSVVAMEENQKIFTIPFSDYNKDNCYLDIKVHSVWINPERYVINGNEVIFNGTIDKGTKVFFTIYYLGDVNTEVPKKATSEEALAGLDDTKFMTPKKTKEVMRELGTGGGVNNVFATAGKEYKHTFTTAGSSFDIPEGKYNQTTQTIEIYYKGLRLTPDEEYSINGNKVTFSFEIEQNGTVQYIIQDSSFSYNDLSHLPNLDLKADKTYVDSISKTIKDKGMWDFAIWQDNVDYNTLTKAGYYRIGTGANRPYECGVTHLEVLNPQASIIVQRAVVVHGKKLGETFTRVNNGDGWGQWFSNQVDTTVSNPNLLINGGFDVWQESTSFENLASYGSKKYVADMWSFSHGNSLVGWANSLQHACTWSESALTKSTFALKLMLDRISGTGAELTTYIENGKQFVAMSGGEDKYVTVSFYANATSTPLRYIYMRIGETTVTFDGSAGVVLEDKWRRYSFTAKLPTNEVAKAVTYATLNFRFNPIDYHQTVFIAGVKLEHGQVATEYVPRTYQQELTDCYRYYRKYEFHGLGFVDMPAQITLVAPSEVPMRLATMTCKTHSKLCLHHVGETSVLSIPENTILDGYFRHGALEIKSGWEGTMPSRGSMLYVNSSDTVDNFVSYPATISLDARFY